MIIPYDRPGHSKEIMKLRYDEDLNKQYLNLMFSDPKENDLWQKLKSAEMKSNSVNLTSLTKQIYRKEQIGFFPSNFVKRLEINKNFDTKATQNKGKGGAITNKSEKIESSESSEESDPEVNSAFQNMKNTKSESQIVNHFIYN